MSLLQDLQEKASRATHTHTERSSRVPFAKPYTVEPKAWCPENPIRPIPKQFISQVEARTPPGPPLELAWKPKQRSLLKIFVS